MALMMLSAGLPSRPMPKTMASLQFSFEAIGTHWQVTSPVELPAVTKDSLQRAVSTRIEQFDQAYSRFREDSLVSRMAVKPGTYELPADGYTMLSFYKQLYDATDGQVTPLIGNVLSDAGYDASYSLKSRQLSHPPAWQDVLSFTKYNITLKRPAILDFGAAGKGYLVDIVGGILMEAGLHEYVVNAGGDILYTTNTEKYLTVGLENPWDVTEAVGQAEIRNQSICASAGSRRKWGRYHHIISPSSLESPRDILATWVIAPSAMVADGLATALFFSKAASLRNQFDFSYAVLGSDMSLEHARDFPVSMYQA